MEAAREFYALHVASYATTLTWVLILLLLALAGVVVYRARKNKKLAVWMIALFCVWILSVALLGAGTYLEETESQLFLGVMQAHS